MATTLVAGSLVMTANMQFSLTNTQTDGSIQSDPFQGNSYSLLPPDATLFYHGQYSTATTATTIVDLKVLTDALGNAIAFSTVYGFFLQNLNTVSGDSLNVGNSTFNTWNSGGAATVKVGPKGGFWLVSNVDGYAVVATTGNQLKVNAPGANTVTWKLTVVGK